MTTGTRDPYISIPKWKIAKMELEMNVKNAIAVFEKKTGFQVDAIHRTVDNKEIIIWINEEKGDYGTHKIT